MSMNAGNVTGSGATKAYYQNLQNKRDGGNAQETNSAAAPADAYTGGKGKVAGAYSKDSATMQQLYDMAEANHASMRSMVESMLGVGGGKGGHHGQAFWAMAAKGNQSDIPMVPVRVDDATRAKAQELIGEDGYFGVKKVTERIMEFAKALAGSNPSEKEVDNLLDGVKKGFDSVAKMFGGFDKLPDVTKDTYDSIMKAFEDWKVELGFAAAEK